MNITMIVNVFLRDVLVRCFKYTNNKTQAEEIIVYTFASADKLIKKTGNTHNAGKVISQAVDVIGPDVVKQSPQTGQDSGGVKAEMLLRDERMQRLVEALNMLSWSLRQVLVLEHVEMMTPKEISLIYNEPMRDIIKRREHGQKELARHLSSLRGNLACLSGDEACLWLNDLEEVLDLNLKEQFTKSVSGFLAEIDKHADRIQEYTEKCSGQ